MSERSYWEKNPAARSVYAERVRGEKQKNMRIFSEGIGFTAVLFGVFGVCILNFELLLASAAMAFISKAIM